MRVTSTLTTTGIMDEIAPATTAPKLDFGSAGMQFMIDRITDLALGERRVVDLNIPASAGAVREMHYEQMFLMLRETMNAVNEAAGLGVDVYMLPSQVNGLVAEAKARIEQAGSLKFPEMATTKSTAHKAVAWRRPYVHHWLHISASLRKDHVALSVSELREYHRRASLAMPFNDLLSTLARQSPRPGGSPASRQYSYDEVMACVCEWDAARYAPLRAVFDRYAMDGMLGEAGFAEFLIYTKAAPCDRHGRAVTASSEFYRILCDLGMRFIQKDKWSFVDFVQYIVHGSQGALHGNLGARPHSSVQGVYQDMTRPLHHYYIAASRHSWLTMTDQLTSDSSVAMLARALQSGSRLVELDCHDGEGGAPTVYLAWTKNTPIPLRDCLEAIKEYGFVTSPYPVIISATLHYGMHTDAGKQLDQTAQMFKAVFGTSLAAWGDDGVPPEDASPEAYKYRFLLKCEKRSQEVSREHRGQASSAMARRMSQANFKRAKLGVTVVDIRSRRAVKVVGVEDGGIAARAGVSEGNFIEGVYWTSGELQATRTVAEFQMAAMDPRALDGDDELRLRINQRDVTLVLGTLLPEAFGPIGRTSSAMSNSAESDTSDGNAGCDSSDEDRPAMLVKWKQSEIRSRKQALGARYKRLPVNKDLSKLSFLAPMTRRGAISGEWWEVIQMQRNQMQFFARRDIVNVAKRHMVNVIPDKALLNSENVHPRRAWEVGVQMISQNYQNPCENFKTARGYFADNGGCGYVLKPPHLRGGGEADDDGTTDASNEESQVSLTPVDSTDDLCMPVRSSPRVSTGKPLPRRPVTVTVLGANGLPPAPTPRRVAVYLSEADGAFAAARAAASPPSLHDAWGHTTKAQYELPKEMQMLVVTVFRDPTDGEKATPGYDGCVLVGDAYLPLHLWAEGLCCVPLCPPEAAPQAGEEEPVAICYISFDA